MELNPIGITPKYIWLRKRIEDLVSAMDRYTEVGKEYPQEWYDEYIEHSKETVRLLSEIQKKKER